MIKIEAVPVFSVAGQTLLLCQQFELSLSVMYVGWCDAGLIKPGKRGDPEEVLAQATKMTAGSYLKPIIEKTRKDDRGRLEDWRDSLQDALDARNEFVHGFLASRINREISEINQKKIIAEMLNLKRRIQEGKDLVDQSLLRIFQKVYRFDPMAARALVEGWYVAPEHERKQ